MSDSHGTSKDKTTLWVVALVLALVLILCEIVYFLISDVQCPRATAGVARYKMDRL